MGRYVKGRYVKADHTSDGVNTGRRRKLTDEQVAEARRMLGPGFKTQVAVAKHFGVKVDTLRAALARPASPAAADPAATSLARTSDSGR